jgi:preprotein translocase subunit SecF
VQNGLFVTGIGRVQVNKAIKPYARVALAADRYNVFAYWHSRTSIEPQFSLVSGLALEERSDIFHLEGQNNWNFNHDRGRVVYGASVRNTQVNTSGNDIMIIRSSVLSEDMQKNVLDTLAKQFNDRIIVRQSNSVGPTVSGQITSRAGLAILLSSLALVAFVTYSFRGIQHAFRYGVCTVIALIHDVMIILTLVAIGGRLFGWQVDTLYLTALLTVIAFSAQDTIVVFDRIRENANNNRRMPFEKVVNQSINQTLDRSIYTQLTVMMVLLAMVIFGGATIRHFVTILLIGVFSGTYSSIFNAAPILVVWENREWRGWFSRLFQGAAS